MEVGQNEGDDGESLAEAHIICKDPSSHAEVLVVLAVRHPS